MAPATLARKLSKITFYIMLSVITGRLLGHPEKWLDDSIVCYIGHIFYDDGEIGADNFHNLYFCISVISIFPITTISYILTMKLILKIRSS